MHGVSADLDLRAFHGAFLTQVVIDPWDLQFVFLHSTDMTWRANITIEGRWELRDMLGSLVESGIRGVANSDHGPFRVNRLLDHVVTGTLLDPPKSIALTFDNGHILTLFDDSNEFESFSIQPGGIFV